jgi:hypothetical protein
LPVAAAHPIVLTAAEEQHRLRKAAHGHSIPHRDRLPVQIVLPTARGRSNAAIARETGAHLDTLRTLANPLRRRHARPRYGPDVLERLSRDLRGEARPHAIRVCR